MTQPVREVSKLWGDEASRFGALLAADRRQSLAERWKHLVQKRPDVAAADFAFMPALLEHGWAVMAVPEDGVIYTIGLSYHFDHPELLLHAPELLKDESLIPALQVVLNHLGARVREGERISAGQRVSVGGVQFDFQPYRDEDFDQAPCGYLGGFAELFDDVVHDGGGTMPVLWSTTRSPGPAPAKAKPKPKPKVKPQAKAKVKAKVKAKPRAKAKAKRRARK